MHEVARLCGHQAPVWSVAWHPKSQLLASASSDATVRLWHRNGAGSEWSCRAVLEGDHTGTVRCVAFSPCGTMLATAGFDSEAMIYKYKGEEFEQAAVIKSHDKELKGVSWSRTGQLLAICGRDKSVGVYELDEDDDFECVGLSEGTEGDLKCVLWHPTDNIFLTGGYDNHVSIHAYDGVEEDWLMQSQFEAHQSTVWSLAFDQSGNRLCTCSADKTVKVWRRTSQDKWDCNVCTIDGHHDGPVYSVAWCAVTGLMATACEDNAIRIFSEDQKDSFDVHAVKDNAHAGGVNCVAWKCCSSMEEQLLASCGDDCTVKLWFVP